MNRPHVLCLVLGCLAALTSLAGCRSGVGSLPAAGPLGVTQRGPLTAADELAAGPRTSSRVMPFDHLGKSNTVTADMPVPRPDTQPCIVNLFSHYVFKNFNDKMFDYNPPAQCPGPWAKVVFNFDVRVTKGVQFDRTGIIWVDGAVVYFGSTAEPSPNLGPHWHVERDVTDLSALFTQGSQGQVQLWNCYCPPDYNAYQIGTAVVQFYPPTRSIRPRASPTKSLAFHTTRRWAAWRRSRRLLCRSRPRCPPTSSARTSTSTCSRRTKKSSGSCASLTASGATRKTRSASAGTPPSAREWSASTARRRGSRRSTRGSSPAAWTRSLVPDPRSADAAILPFRVDLTPFAGVLSNGAPHTVDVRVIRAFNYFSGAGDLLLYLDPKRRR